MKNISFLKAFSFAILLSAFLSSCDLNEKLNSDEFVDYQSIETSALPTNAQVYLEETYPNSYINAYQVAGDDEIAYEADIDNSFNVNFDGDGEVVGFGPAFSKRHRKLRNILKGISEDEEFFDNLEEIDSASLPEAAHTVLQDSLEGNPVIKAFKATEEEEINYYVLVKKVGLVIFNADGSLQEIKEIHLRKGPLKDAEDITKVEVDALPEAIQTYLTENHPEAEAMKAISGTVEGTLKYVVFVKKYGVLVFDAEGTLLASKEMKKTGGRFKKVKRFRKRKG